MRTRIRLSADRCEREFSAATINLTFPIVRRKKEVVSLQLLLVLLAKCGDDGDGDKEFDSKARSKNRESKIKRRTKMS